jgi:hypothetical protein
LNFARSCFKNRSEKFRENRLLSEKNNVLKLRISSHSDKAEWFSYLRKKKNLILEIINSNFNHKKNTHMKTILFVFLTLSVTTLFAQTECKMQNFYGDFLKAEKLKHGEMEYIIKSVNPVITGSCIENLVNNNIQYIDYLLTHFSDGKMYSELVSIEVSVEMQIKFSEKLANDSLFNALMTEFADKTINKKLEKDSIDIDYLINLAVKYFAILSINKDGHFSTRICTGFNLIKETEPERNPLVEAFVFSSVFKNLNSEKYNLYVDFVGFVRNIYKLNLGTANNERLLRAQGALFMAMRENSKLREMLIDEYNNKKEFLPFELEY